MNIVQISCDYCSKQLWVNQKETKDAKARCCINCFPVRFPMTYMMGTQKDSDEFEKELELILGNDELEFDDMADWEVTGENPGNLWGPRCECGAIKAKLKYHATWCPMYADPMGK